MNTVASVGYFIEEYII